MAFEPSIQPGEQISADISFSNKPVRRLVLTDRAAYWSGSKFLDFVITTERVPLAEVVSVIVRTDLHQGGLIVGPIMFISGLVGMFMPLMTGVGRRRFLSTPEIVVCAVSFILFGIGMLVAMRGGRRRTLIIASAEKTFSWTEPHTFGVANGSSMFEQASAWAESNGLPLEVHQEEKRA